ncbi:MAG: hypothetical protein O2894_02240, partial [Planctomycetota bacterium]|nr:hypothetical protein [Planctomycetota bacterium]
DDAEFEDEPGGRRGRKESNNALIIGAISALVVVVVLVVIIVTSKDDPKTPTPETANVPSSNGGNHALTGLAPTEEGPDEVEDVPADAAGTTPAKGDASKSAPAKGDAEAAAKAARQTNIRGIQLKVFEWPEEVDAETRTQVDQAVRGLYAGGRDAMDARDYLQAKGRVICGRLISEFKTLQDSPGFQDREGASVAGAIDSVLRSIDGWQERRWKEQNQIRVSSQPSVIEHIAKRWTAWWESDEWQKNPREPWDPMTDSFEEEEKKKDDKKDEDSGFGKRAGDD